ncbi:DUF3298 and DUF4163 domain-containing protein [Pedobacter antarcticus]|uniref:DUF3298 domain-containing protein n=2 Tax=Pedobacter antarcticus TaxID=34086 RepID=A0A081PG03_9SPHI|nr:DUF3298 and DUF4163 domain-containing protein [Pedobacter antarcticus]KEQ29626.1 hypothetical protein N180_18875 [Pedobacter antarcticus 4BY]SDM60676.1 protein of unknown function [Pedobacter antarcticus]SFE58865.1 protein of unknown function [Pedobacter antarcticus]
MKTKSIAGLILLTGLYACTSNTPKGKNTADQSTETVSLTDTLKYKFDSVKVVSTSKLLGEGANQEPTTAKVIFPVFNTESVNQYVTNEVLSLSGKKLQFKTYNELTAGFIKEFDVFNTKDNNPNGNSWFEYIDLKVAANYPNYLSLKFTYSEYKGGAHPNTLFSYLNYNPQSGKVITLDSLVKTDSKTQLVAVAEKIFRKNEKLSTTASLSDGYFFDGGKFALAQTFTLTPDGLMFLYNPYEIKPYAAGVTELIIPYSQIKEFLKPASVLNNFIH